MHWRALTLLCVAIVAAVNLYRLAATVLPPVTAEAPAAMLDYVTRSELRFGRFRHAAQARGLSGTIGYIEDLRGNDPEWPDFEPDYFVAQFVVLPLVLDADLERTLWALGHTIENSTDPDLRAWAQRWLG